MKMIKAIASVGLVIGMGYGLAWGCNHVLNDGEYVAQNHHSVTRADGASGFTKVTRYETSLGDLSHQINRYGGLFGDSVDLNDGFPYGVNDGLVDRLILDEENVTRELMRTQDFDTYREAFEDADQLLAETKERFREYFPERL